MKTTVLLFLTLSGLSLAAGTGKLDYFEPAALERVDMTGVKEEIDAVLARCDGEFQAAEQLALTRSGREQKALELRIEIGRRLERYVIERHADGAKDLEIMAWQGAKELNQLFGYFAAERSREKARRTQGERVVLNLSDFGAKGDGKTDCGDAFRAAAAKAKTYKGRPVTIRVGSGVFAVAYRPEVYPAENAFPVYRDYDEKGVCRRPIRPRKFSQYGTGFHLPFFGLENVTIEGGFDSEVRFLDSVRGGFAFFGCTETVLRNVKISYRDNPSTQGTVLSLLPNETGFVFKRDPGFPDPDEPRFVEARSCRFTVHSGADQLVGMKSTGRMGSVRRISDDTFEFRPFENLRNNGVWRSVQSGDRMIVIARYSEDSNGFPVNFMLSSFSGAEGVRIYDAPGQNIMLSSSYATHLYDCRVTIRHGSSDLVTSNADGMMGSGMIGPYVDGCVFEHMEDDGFNIGTAGCPINSISKDRMSVYPHGCDTPVAFQIDAVTGRIKDVVRRGKSWEKVARPMCPETLTKEELDGGKLKEIDRREWNRRSAWNGTKGERLPDKFNSVPGTVGAIIRNTRLYDLRGMGIQVHCANMIIENVEVEHVQGPGASLNALFGWGMLFNTHNILVRNSTFKDVACGFVVQPGSVQPGIVPTQKMFQGIDLVDNVVETRNNKPVVNASNCQAVRIDHVKFTLRVQRKAEDTKSVQDISSDYADIIRSFAEGENIHRIEYHYTASNAPVKVAIVHVERDPVDGARRYRLRVSLAAGWHLRQSRFPEYDLPLVRGGDPSDDRLIVGASKGGYHENLASTWNGVCYCAMPGSAIAQFAAIWDDDSGVYFGMEDAAGYPKTFGFERKNKAITFYQYEDVWKEGGYEMAYPVVVREVKRVGEPLVWQDFADIYREWGHRQFWAKTKFRDRKDIPSWLKDAAVFTRFSRQWLERPEDMKRFVTWWKQNFGDMPVVAALWGWEKHGTWWGPDYFPCHPSDDIFKKEMEHLSANGFRAFSWPSGYNWCKYIGDKGDGTYEIDLRNDWIKPNEKHLVVNPDGTLFHQDAFWLRFGALTTVCGGDPWARDWWCSLTKDLGRRGVDLVQVDQVVGGRIRDCWSTSHGHPQGTGLWKWQAFRAMIEHMRKDLKSIRPDGVVGVEEPCELFQDVVGIQDYRDMETNKEKFADIYGYLYQDYMLRFQSNVHRDEFLALAHMAASGQMPFFRPDFEELDESRPALINGGFENLIDSVRGPTGWERLYWSYHRLSKNDPPLWNFAGYNNMGWFGYSVTLDYAVKHGGAVSLKFDPPAKGGRDDGRAMEVSQTIDNLEPGVYTVSAWVKCDDPKAPAGQLLWGTREGEIGRLSFPTDSTEWTLVKAEVKVVDQLRLIIYGVPGSRFHIDDLKLERAAIEVRVSGDSPYVVFMKDWIRLYRGAGRAFIVEGEQIKPPYVTCDTIRVSSHVEPVVRVGAYRNSKGEEALVFANASNRRQPFSYRWKGRTYKRTIAPHGLELVK